jgi:plasmid stabilization system protein ParE
MYKIIHSIGSKKDQRQALKWYHNINPQLAERFQNEIEHSEQFISKHPKITPSYNKNIRRYPLKRFPYYIFYILNETKNIIQILTIRHNKRNEYLNSNP